ncbi:Ribosomal RNA large subunit methyltransferase G [Stutzerimonas stutzeri]
MILLSDADKHRQFSCLFFDTPYARLDLIRQPEQPNEPLQAFDAADEYLLAELHPRTLPATTRVLILNDSFGALACALAAHVEVTSSGDSHLAHLALQKNLARNGLPAERARFVPASEVAQGPFDLVLIRVPKTLALLEEQLIRLHGQLAPDAQVIAAAMIKHLPRAAGDLLEQYIGPLQASLAVKKARLLTATPSAKPAPQSPYPTRYKLDQPKLELLNHANLFCPSKAWISAPAPSCRICPRRWVCCAWPISVAATACSASSMR